MKNIDSLTTSEPTTPVRVLKHSGEYRKDFVLPKANEAMMGAKAFWDSSKEISAVLVKIVQVVFSHMSLLLLQLSLK